MAGNCIVDGKNAKLPSMGVGCHLQAFKAPLSQSVVVVLGRFQESADYPGEALLQLPNLLVNAVGRFLKNTGGDCWGDSGHGQAEIPELHQALKA